MVSLNPQTLSVALGSVFAVCAAITFYDGYLWSWHPVLLSISYAVLMPLSVSLGRAAATGSSTPQERERNTTYHGLAGFGAAALLFAGVFAMMLNKARKGRAHFSSTHAMWAQTSMVPVLLAGALGSWIRYGSSGPKTNASLKKLHRGINFFSYATGAVAFYLGLATVDRGLVTTLLEVTYATLAVLVVGPAAVDGKLTSARGLRREHLMYGAAVVVAATLANYLAAGTVFDALFSPAK